MDDQAFVDIAYAALERANLSTADMTPHVKRSHQGLTEVAFDTETQTRDADIAQTHRVFMVFGSLLGVVLADGTTPHYKQWDPALRPIKGEDPIEAATRYLNACSAVTSAPNARLIAEPKLVTVWTSDDLQPDTMGRRFEVHMTDTGTVVRCHGAHSGTVVFPSGLEWGAGTRLYNATLDVLKEVGNVDDDAALDAFQHASQGGQFVFGQLGEPLRSHLLSTIQSEAYRERLLSTFADGQVPDAATFRARVEDLHAMALAENELPDWLSYDRHYGVIVKGLLWKPIEERTGAQPWPVQKSRIDETIRYEMTKSRITVDVELEPDSKEAPDGAVVADVGDARFVVSGDRVDHDRLSELAILLAQAHAQANQHAEG